MFFTFLVVALGVLGGTDAAGVLNTDEWTEAIAKLLNDHKGDYDAKNSTSVAKEFTSDGHRLAPGSRLYVGLEVLADCYRSQVSHEYLEKLEMTDIRFVCGDGAVAEFMVADEFTTGKGLIFARLEDGIPKIATLIYNMDKQ